MNLCRTWINGTLCLALLGTFGRPIPATGEEAPAPKRSAEAEQPVDAKLGEPLAIGSVRCSRILYLGNSITLHGPAPQIGWTGNWGMAATAEGNDYVHLLTQRIATAAKGEPAIRVRNIADFERNYDRYDVAAELKSELAFQPELVIVAIGENVAALRDAAARDRFRTAVEGLLKTLDGNGHPTIVVRSGFWADPAKDEALEEAARGVGGTFVDIRTLGADPTMAARSERKIEHDGVAGHPGDKGMKAIADALWKGLEKRAAEKPKK